MFIYTEVSKTKVTKTRNNQYNFIAKILISFTFQNTHEKVIK